MENSYVRIGTAYYKYVDRPLVNGTSNKSLIPWSLECIKQDHEKSFISTIKKYDGYCFVPQHIDYKREILNFYNKYQPFNHIAIPGYPTQTLMFLKHIFGEQLEIGIDYMKILLIYPTQMLPILSLVSKERNTGKTTFLNFMKFVFGDNMTINSNEDFRSNFNAEWAQKLIIAVDETFLDRKEDSERIKALSTSKYYKIEAKGVDRMEIEFFGKFILCSNNEENFIKIDPCEIRFWVRKIPSLVSDNKNLLQELKVEIPYFIDYLLKIPFYTSSSTRMWFSARQLYTEALLKIKRFNTNKLEVEMAQLLLNILDSNDEIIEINFSVTDIQQWLQKKGIKGNENTKLKGVLQNEWKLKPSSNSYTYTQYNFGIDGNILIHSSKGRFYSVTKDEVLKLNNLDDFDEMRITN